MTLLARQADGEDLSADTHVASLVSVAVVFAVICTLGLAARVACKIMKKLGLFLEDYLLILSWMLAIAEMVIIIWGAFHSALGHHAAVSTAQEISDYQKVLFAAELLQPTLLTLAKVSVLLLLRRIFITKSFRITCWVLIGVITAWWTGIFFAQVFACEPIESRWDTNIQGHCNQGLLGNIIAPIPWIVTDIVVLLIPIPMVRKLYAPTKQKVAIGAIFLIGILTCIVSIVRYRYGFIDIEDPTYSIAPLFNWNVIEASVTVLCASLLACKPVFVMLLPQSLANKIHLYFSKPASLYSKYLRRHSSQQSGSDDFSGSEDPTVGGSGESYRKGSGQSNDITTAPQTASRIENGAFLATDEEKGNATIRQQFRD